jgi:phosphatidylglycerophosphatase A
MTTSRSERSARAPLSIRLLREPVHLFALGFGSGLAPVAPGTFGSMVGVAIALVVLHFGLIAAITATAIVTLAGIWICGESARRLGVHDHPGIVWDEVAGMMIAMLAAPRTWWGLLLAFGLFRLFDIWKPWPIREIDHGMRGGAGIMLDDVMAGFLAVLVLLVVRYAL